MGTNFSKKSFQLLIAALIAALPLLFSCAGNHIVGERTFSGATVSEDSVQVRVITPIYSLTIRKSDAQLFLENGRGEKFTSFPLAAYFGNDTPIYAGENSYHWKVNGHQLFAEQFSDDSVFSKFQMEFFENCFTVKFFVHPPQKGIGTFLLRKGDIALETKGWSEYFSPEPDDYYSSKPQIDIRTDRDQQWKFAPAPLNLSFLSPAGWISFGIVDLPDASIFAFRENSLWLDIPWQKLALNTGQLYPLPELLISCNRSEWDAVKDYSDFVFRKEFSSNHQSLETPQWWKSPIISPLGETLKRQFSEDDHRYTLNWIKNFLDSMRVSWIDSNFIFIIEGKWNRVFGDPTPSSQFANLRQFIDECHQHDIRVILSWKAWQIAPDSKAVLWGLHDGEMCDATHHLFPAYVDSSCKIMIGDQPNGLNADGIQIENLFLTPKAETADFENPNLGVGIKEAYRYLAEFYRQAKYYKEDALVISSAVDPHFYFIQDMVNLQEDWDNKLRREKRARIIVNSLPGKLINAGSANMYNKLAPYHFSTSALFGMPALEYVSSFVDGTISEGNKNFILQAIRFAARKPEGVVSYSDYGKWIIRAKDGDVRAETVEKGKGIITFRSNSRAELISAHDGRMILLMDNFEIRKVSDENGNQIAHRKLADGIFELQQLKCGNRYLLNLRKIPNFR